MTLENFNELQRNLRFLLNINYGNPSPSKTFLCKLRNLKLITEKEYNLYCSMWSPFEDGKDGKVILFYTIIEKLYLKYKDIIRAKT